MNTTFTSEQMKPVENNILVQPGPVKKIRTLQYNVENAGVNPRGDSKIETPKETYERMPTNMRIGKVLGISETLLNKKDVHGNPIGLGYAVGDWVVYNSQRGYQQKLDLLAKKSDDDKCPIIMQVFEVVCKINIEE